MLKHIIRFFGAQMKAAMHNSPAVIVCEIYRILCFLRSVFWGIATKPFKFSAISCNKLANDRDGGFSSGIRLLGIVRILMFGKCRGYGQSFE